jgi:hypothetical protein
VVHWVLGVAVLGVVEGVDLTMKMLKW